MTVQNALWCGCGSLLINRLGRCARCDRRRRLSQESFGGLRETVLARDGRCRACGSIEDLLVHHRRSGVNLLPLLVTLCRPCHTRIHRTWRPRAGQFCQILRSLWREQNRELAEQRELPLRRIGSPPDQPPAHQPNLLP